MELQMPPLRPAPLRQHESGFQSQEPKKTVAANPPELADPPEMNEKLRIALENLRTKPTVSLWPDVGALLNLSRGSVYAAAERGEIPVLKIGRLLKVPTAPLRQRLGIG